MATILNLKTKNQIYKEFKTFVSTALSAFSITDWEVKKLHQIIKTEDLKPSVFIQVLNKKQLGYQYRNIFKTVSTTYNKNFTGFQDSGFQPLNQVPYWDKSVIKTEQTSYYRNYNIKQEVTIRFSATRRELLNDTVSTLNGFDVLEIIKNYFQSMDGIKMLSLKNYAQYRANDIQEQTFTNDDENIQLMPYFDCVYLYTDTWYNPADKIDYIEEKEIIGE